MGTSDLEDTPRQNAIIKRQKTENATPIETTNGENKQN